jgi:hypothetical protein
MIIYPEMPSVSPIYQNTKYSSWYKSAWSYLTVPTFWDMCDDYVHIMEDGTVLLLPYLFRFDGASAPRVVWPFINPSGCLFMPGGFHDFGYRFNCLLRVTNFSTLLNMKESGAHSEEIRQAKQIEKYHEGAPRSEFDLLFRKLCNEMNSFTPINWIAWKMLQRFGWVAWNNWRKKDNETRNQIDFWINGARHIGEPQSGNGLNT